MDRPSRHAIPTLVLYGDVNCPFSAIAGSRAVTLEADGVARVDWRFVEHDPTIGPHETPLTDGQRAAFGAELDRIRDLLAPGEPDRLRVPSRRLNTRDLNLRYAATPIARRAELRSRLFDAYWCDDLDLTDEAVVDGLIRSLPRLDPPADGSTAPSEEQARRSVLAWQAQWRDLGQPIVPAMVLPDGYVSRGLGVLARLLDGSWSRPIRANAR